MMIEFAGIPGSGKTTLARQMKAEMDERGLKSTDVNTAANRIPDRKSAPRFVTAKPQRQPLFRFLQFSKYHPDFVNMVTELYDKEFIKRFLYFLLASNYQAALAQKYENEFVIMDEGFLTYGVAACLTKNSRGKLEQLITLSPSLDTIVFLNVTPEMAFGRAVNRHGQTEKIRANVVRKFGELPEFKKRDSLLREGLEIYKNKGIEIIDVDPSMDVKQSAVHAVDRIVSIAAGK